MDVVKVAYEYPVFTIDELSMLDDSSAWERAIDGISTRAQPEADWVDDDLQQQIQWALGENAKVVSWQVGWCQSDHAAFTATFPAPLVTGDVTGDFPAWPTEGTEKVTHVSIKATNRDGHEVDLTFDWDDEDMPDGMTWKDWCDLTGPIADKAYDVVRDWVQDVAQWLYGMARAEYEHWFDEGPCVEYARDMVMMFREDGTIE